MFASSLLYITDHKIYSYLSRSENADKKWLDERRPWPSPASSTCSSGRANGCPMDDDLARARANGCPWQGWKTANAAFEGHLEVLQWARANGCPRDHLVLVSAAEQGHRREIEKKRK
jgi:hypothetical protein